MFFGILIPYSGSVLNMNSGRRSPRRQSWLAQQLRRRPLPAWLVALAHLLALGFSEPVARYAYRYMLDNKSSGGSVLTMTEVDGVPMLHREAKP